ncbi:MAG TPA: MOSC domain-containing protein [Acidimicrobiales bacterium]|nr:MOSC domain-containing protein [Acidimicrobiales bacterium]
MTRCAECGFDADAWRPADARSLLNALDTWWLGATEGVSAVSLRELDGVARQFRDVTASAPSLSDDELIGAAHAVSHQQFSVSRALLAMGSASPRRGRVEQINASGGGVPKLPVASGRVGFGGLEGDTQADRKHHGRPFQALCLWSSEVIAELAAAGHPIGRGCAGENLTVSGLDWTAMRPGTLLRIGTVLAEVSFPATPCAKQTRWFTDGDFRRIDHDRNPQWTRWYAWVRQAGAVMPGDAVMADSPDAHA